MLQIQFADIILLIKEARANSLKAVNTELINLYWQIGEYISKRVTEANWGDKTVEDLALYIQQEHPELKGFDRRGLYRMKQFYETYISAKSLTSVLVQPIVNQTNVIVSSLRTQFPAPIVSSLGTQLNLTDIRGTILTKLSWTHHRTIFSRCKGAEEITFYLNMSVKEAYTVRELDRQISASLFERSMTGTQSSPTLKKTHPDITNTFKDKYIFEFLNLPEIHSEGDLQKELIRQMKNFILELGKDFLFIGEGHKIQVGNSDFYIDLLFFHRELQCLVAFELKADKFKPAHLGQLNFYLEALDRDLKKEKENPSIGVLLCKDKDTEVVEYALSRNLSPALVAEYKTQLPNKELLQRKLHELFEAYNQQAL